MAEALKKLKCSTTFRGGNIRCATSQPLTLAFLKKLREIPEVVDVIPDVSDSMRSTVDTEAVKHVALKVVAPRPPSYFTAALQAILKAHNDSTTGTKVPDGAAYVIHSNVYFAHVECSTAIFVAVFEPLMRKMAAGTFVAPVRDDEV